LQTRDDGRPREDCGDFELGSTEKCETVVHYSGTYEILQEVYQRLFPDHRADGKIIEEGCLVLLKQ